MNGRRCGHCGSLQPLYRFPVVIKPRSERSQWCEDCRKEYRSEVDRVTKRSREYQRAHHFNGTGLVDYRRDA